MKKYKAFVLIKATILILAIIPLLLEGFNHMQYKIRSPEKGLLRAVRLQDIPAHIVGSAEMNSEIFMRKHLMR